MTFDEFLIESYYSPFFNQPFPKEMDEYLKFMDIVADYLCSFVKKSDQRPLVSVIMPVYNRMNTVMKAIDSVLSQSYDNFELIIVDNASTDGTVELLKEIEHEKIRVFFHSENKDCCASRNTALKNANGDFITYLDSDNQMDKRFIEANLGMFLKFPDADCVYSAQSRHEDYNTPAYSILFGQLNKSALLNRNFIDTGVIFHKKEVLDKVIGFDEALVGEEDWDLILKISNNYKIYCAPFLQSKYYTGVVTNRRSKYIQSKYKQIHENNEQFYTNCNGLNRNVNILIPMYESDDNINECLSSISYLNFGDKVKIIISNNNSKIDLTNLKLDDNMEISGEKTDLGFCDCINQGISYCSDDADILILNQKASLTKGSLESLQKYAYDLNDCGLAISQKIVRNTPLIKEYFVGYINDEYWIDIAPYEFDDNIVKIPLFYDGNVLELRYAPFFCIYLKREILNNICDFDFKFKDEKVTMRMFSNHIRHNIGLKIFHISDAKVFKK